MGVRRRCTAVALLALGLAFGPASAGALATPADVAATHAYIRANFALAQASEARAARAQDNVNSFTARIARECPNVGAGSLQNEESQQFSSEAAGALWSVSYGTAVGPIRAFRHTVERLRWSNPKLTRMAHGYASSLYALATLRLPDLCGDVGAWKASGFHTVPAATASFDSRVEGIEAHTIPSRLLAPYEQRGDRGVLARTERLERELEGTEIEIGFDDWLALLETLGLHQ
jgi:hypothetical protein